MESTRLKYNIKNRLSKVSKAEHSKTLSKIFVGIAPMSSNSFYRWMRVKQFEKSEIPFSCLQAIAKVFACTPEELINPVKKIEQV